MAALGWWTPWRPAAGTAEMKTCLALLVLPALLSAANLSEQQRTRIGKLEAMFLGPCCYSEPIARHRSDVALEMKAEVARWVNEGKSDREIIDTYKARYGSRVLVEPEGQAWWWMHVIPWVVLSAGLAVTVHLVRRMRGPAGIPEPTSQGSKSGLARAMADEDFDTDG